MIIPTPQNTKTITDLRERALELLNQVKKSGPTYILHRSKPKAVMLSIEEYVNFVEALEEHGAVASVLKSKKQAEKGEAKLLLSLKNLR